MSVGAGFGIFVFSVIFLGAYIYGALLFFQYFKAQKKVSKMTAEILATLPQFDEEDGPDPSLQIERILASAVHCPEKWGIQCGSDRITSKDGHFEFYRCPIEGWRLVKPIRKQLNDIQHRVLNRSFDKYKVQSLEEKIRAHYASAD